MGRGVSVPLPNKARAQSILYRYRLGYLGTSGPPSASPAFSSEWSDTSQAQRLNGTWDTPAGTPDRDFSFPVSYSSTSSGTSLLCFQYVFPAWDDLIFLGGLYDGMVLQRLVGLYGEGFGGGSIMAQWNPGSVQGATTYLAGVFVSIARIFRADDTLKYTLTLRMLPQWSLNSPATISRFIFGDGSNNSLPAFQNLTCRQFSDERQRNLTAAKGDYLVLEIGVMFFVLATPVTGTMLIKMGDGHAIDNVGVNSGDSSDTQLTGTPGNTNVWIAYRSARIDQAGSVLGDGTIAQGPGSDSWQVSMSELLPGGSISGQVRGLAAGAVAFPNQALTQGVVVTAYSGNSGPVTLGALGTTNVFDGTGNSKILEPGESVGVAVDNTNALYLATPVDGRFVTYLGS